MAWFIIQDDEYLKLYMFDGGFDGS